MSHSKLTPVLVLMIALIAGTAIAGGDFTVYGKLHLSTDLMNNSEDSQIRLSSNTSRFGLKGASEMNEDWTMFWKFENAINMAQKTGYTGIANRNTYIGVKHEYGSILFGIHDTPFKTVGRKSTFFFDSLGDHRTVTMGMDKRLEDIVMFTTKNYEGMQFSFMYQFDQNAIGALEAANTISASGMYKKDGIFVGAAIETYTVGNYGMAGDWDNDATTADTWGVGSVDSTYTLDYVPEAPLAFRAGLGYNADAFAVRGFFQSLSNKGGVKDLSALTMGGEFKYLVNDDYSGKAAFYMADPNTDMDDDEYNLLAFGLDRHFGKSQYLYLQYAMVMNGDAAGAPLGGGWHGNSIAPSAVGEAPFGISAGIVKVW